MCATYLIKAQRDVWKKQYGIQLPDDWEGYDERIVPFKMAPIIRAERRVIAAQFSLIPSWSMDPKPKFSTYNARIEEIETKKTWAQPFRKFHCVVPINEFIEPIYESPASRGYEGKMMTFRSDTLLMAAGIYNTWTDPKAAEVIESFALLMQPASNFIAHVGHDRSPIFLNELGMNQWLESEGGAPEDLKVLLKRVQIEPLLKVAIDRAMKPGWQKRISH